MFKRFFLGIIIRIVLLLGAVFLLTLSWLEMELFFNSLVFGALAIAISVELLTYLSRSFRDVQYFLDAIYYDDLSLLPKKKFKDRRLKKLYARLNDIREKYRVKRIAKEEHLAFLKEAIQSAPIGIMSWDESGNIGLFNNSLSQYIQLEPLQHTARFQRLRPLLWKQLTSIAPGTTGIMKYEVDENEIKLSARKINIKQGDKKYSMVLVQNIGDVLDQAEISAWERLIKILTHELMNGVTIISSLSGTMIEMLEAEVVNEQDLVRAASAIHKRSLGMLDFVEDYRALSQIPSPKIESLNLSIFFEEMVSVWKSTHQTVAIILNKKLGKPVLADPKLLHQVFENLMLNSVHAMRGKSEMKVKIDLSEIDGNRAQIIFKDNGAGMDKETLDNALVPFYTTRDTGSGIGLALSRQMIRSHNGSLHILSEKKSGTSIIITLPLA